MQSFTSEEVDFLRSKSKDMTCREAAIALGRNHACVRTKAHSMGIKFKRVKYDYNQKKYNAYTSWSCAIQRCTNPNIAAYDRYGGRGITICQRWRDSFECFLEDMGERPRGFSLDRIDPNGNYCKENCRWIPKSEQSKTTVRALNSLVCKVCGGQIGNRKGRCHKCNEYFRRNGIERPTCDSTIKQIQAKKMSLANSRPVCLADPAGAHVSFPSIRAAAVALGVGPSAVWNMLSGRSKSCRGYTQIR